MLYYMYIPKEFLMFFFDLYNPFYWANQLFPKAQTPDPKLNEPEYEEEFDDPSDQDYEGTSE